MANKLNLLIIVDTTGGVGECKINGTMRVNLLRDLSKKYERTASQVCLYLNLYFCVFY